jgi:hypothetical protein
MSEPERETEVRTVAELVAALDGAAAAAGLFGERERTVRVWMHRNRLPARKFVQHTELLRSRHVVAPQTLWGQGCAA